MLSEPDDKEWTDIAAESEWKNPFGGRE